MMKVTVLTKVQKAVIVDALSARCDSLMLSNQNDKMFLLQETKEIHDLVLMSIIKDFGIEL